ncbi:MAG TPA: 2-oxo-4-hydroxy-4-carboxy-5-ureidoimidazoline decarboxylase, partial [Alphaproteobacteria bacterium]|nr:2-oxo-4-hydroxy-4-carboxy-5-ureidoimidazoline decarboxylase [Alphaproteobacteria bacterium]
DGLDELTEVATALARNPQAVAAMQEAGWEIASHGLKWIDYRDHDIEHERRDLHEAIRIHTEVTGSRPTGWYCGRTSVNTVDLASEEGGFLYVSDTYDDDLPYYREHLGMPQLIIPYSLATNDMRFTTASGFANGEEFYQLLKDTFDVLYAEGEAGSPKMMSVGLHCRLVGMPGRFAGLKRFVEYILGKEQVWIARRIDIARHWLEHHPYQKRDIRPSQLQYDDFTALFGNVFERSEWVAERTFRGELGPAHDTATGLHAAMCQVFRAASEEERLGVLRAHPDLAGRIGEAERLTDASAEEQASAGLHALTDRERAQFLALNDAYQAKFGFPFIIAVRDHTKAGILKAFERRLGNDRDEEFATACRQVERIAELRLRALLPDSWSSASRS